MNWFTSRMFARESVAEFMIDPSIFSWPLRALGKRGAAGRSLVRATRFAFGNSETTSLRLIAQLTILKPER